MKDSMPPFTDKNEKLKIVEYGQDAVQIRSLDNLKKRLNAYFKKRKESKKR